MTTQILSLHGPLLLSWWSMSSGISSFKKNTYSHLIILIYRFLARARAPRQRVSRTRAPPPFSPSSCHHFHFFSQPVGQLLCQEREVSLCKEVCERGLLLLITDRVILNETAGHCMWAAAIYIPDNFMDSDVCWRKWLTRKKLTLCVLLYFCSICLWCSLHDIDLFSMFVCLYEILESLCKNMIAHGEKDFYICLRRFVLIHILDLQMRR